MTRDDAIKLRHTLGMTQAELATQLGMTTRAWQAIEAGDAELRRIHVLALERVAMLCAVLQDKPLLAPYFVRVDAIKISNALGGDAGPAEQ